MIPNALVVLIGLWLAYSAIFWIPPGKLNATEIMLAGLAIIVLAVWARRTAYLRWQSWTIIVLGVALLALAAVHTRYGLAMLALFWIVLLTGVTVAIVAMWSMIYRHGRGESSASPEG